ncbi:uncharacterized protein LOC120413385 [Culex pipiens pallens]|uniref:uncharacterized protein LOC120413385 n=1 Tax=Culex pipiens pallens TaxID=42434 RepID=UPI00195493C7|nr:uncharacterized protein LOC120413385 [Culex pipiens pallens]
MESIETLLAKQADVINRIETFFDLQASRSQVVRQLNNLHHKARECSDAVNQAKNCLKRFRTDLGPRYAEVIRKMRLNELLILHLLEQLDRTDGGGGDGRKVLQAVQNGNVGEQAVEQEPVSSLKPAASLTTDRKMTLLDYQNSPFVSKMKPRCLSFLDFNVVISQEDFEQIPKYMRGRESVDELVTFLQTVVVACFEEKYTLLYKNKKAITNQQDLALWKAFNLQQAAFPNHKFVTQGDIARKMGRLIDKKVNGKIQMLRHLHIMQETRHEGTVYYFWIRE